MAVYYIFKSAKGYDSIPVDDGHFIPVGALKERIFEARRLGRGLPCDLVVTNAQTEEEYKEDSMIPKNTAVIVKRVPRRRGLPIVVTRPTEEPKLQLVSKEDVHMVNNGFTGLESSSIFVPSEDTEWDFGNDIYDIPDVPPPHTSNQVQDIPSPSKVDEERKIQALIDTPALDWQCQPTDGYGHGRGFGRKINNRNFGFEQRTPPPGYVCHRCNTPGHFIQNCPTNGNPDFDIKRGKPPTGIPISMLKPTPDGSYALSDGSAGALKPNEDAFEKEIEGLPSTRSVINFPPELRCPLCKEVMKDAVFTSKCCFRSFCDKCIRDYTISKSMCVCDATNVLADDLLPNKTLRDTINRMLESNTSSTEISGGAYHIQSPTQSAASKGGHQPPLPPFKEGTSSMQDTPGMVLNNAPSMVGEIEKTAKVKDVPQATHEVPPLPPFKEGTSSMLVLNNAPSMVAEREKTAKVKDVPEATHESASVREPASQGSTPVADEEVQQKPASGDAGKKMKKKKARLPPNAAQMQWRMTQDHTDENYMMPMGPTAYNPYWGMQPGMEGFAHPYAGHVPNMAFGLGPIDVPFGGQGCMMPFPPQRADFGIGFDPVPPPPISREESEAHNAEVRKGREIKTRVTEGRNLPKEREFGKEVSSSGDVSSIKQKYKPILHSSSSEKHYQQQPERSSPDRRSRDPEIRHWSSKRKSDHDDYHHIHRERHQDPSRDERQEYRSRDVCDEPRRRAREEDHHRRESSTAVVKSASCLSDSQTSKHTKSSVFSNISYPEREAAATKKRKLSPFEAPASSSGSQKGLSNGYYEYHHSKTSSKKREAASADYESSDDDRHFKRRRSGYVPSPPPRAEWEKARDCHYSKTQMIY